jgi:hypothetical protein
LPTNVKYFTRVATVRRYQAPRAPYRDLQLSEYPRGNAPSFSADQIDAMNRAFRQACARMGLTGSTPVIELVAVRILELAYGGELDPEKMAETVVAEFGV